MGAAMLGAVAVEGGAEKVREPRLPDELPDPARASAKEGASTRAAAIKVVSTAEERRMGGLALFDCTLGI